MDHPSRGLAGAELRRARLELGLSRRRRDAEPARRLEEDELVVQLLRPLREKGKTSRNRTTPIEHLYGHGVPDHQKDEARDLVETMLRAGLVEEKVSQGRRHVWLTGSGKAALAEAERRLSPS